MPVARFALVVLVVVAVVALVAATAVADPPPGFVREPVLDGIDKPMGLAFLPDGRALVGQWDGQVWIVDPATLPASAAPYLVVPNVDNIGSKGLWNIAVDPDFANHPWVYVYYAHAVTGRYRIARFTHDGDVADAASAHIVWTDTDPSSRGVNHYGGGLTFGPDRKLFATIGEEGMPEQSQDLTRSGGSIVRVDRHGFVPLDNPFVDGAGGNDDTIWAYGLRNPFRASWDLPSRRLLVGDVGLDAWEEINLGVRGANYGWPICDGPCDNPQTPDCRCGVHQDPFFVYPSLGPTAVVAGVVYRGSRFPADPYYGAFFYADFMQQAIRYLTFDASETIVTGQFDFDPDASVTALAEGPDGALYASNFALGTMYRFVREPANEPPVIVSVDATPLQGAAPLEVTLAGTASDPEGDDLVFHWRLGDGAVADGPDVVHTYETNGLHLAYLEVSDDTRTTLTGPIEILVGAAPTAAITDPMPGQAFQAGDVITYAVDASDPDGRLADSDIRWRIRHVHDGVQQTVAETTGPGGTFTVPISGPAFDGESGYLFETAVYDPDGFSAYDSVVIVPVTSQITLETDPAGLDLSLDGIPMPAPVVTERLVGSVMVIGAAAQCLADERLVFESWTDGGAAFHTIETPARDLTLVATYAPGRPASGDVDLDGTTDTQDLVDVLVEWGDCPPEGAPCPADLDCDGVVSVTDLLLVILDWS